MLAPAGPSLPVRRVVGAAAADAAAVGVLGAVRDVGVVVAARVPMVSDAAADGRAAVATRATHAAGTRNRMDPRFLFAGRWDRRQGQPVDNVTNRHTPVDGAWSGPVGGQIEGCLES